jgi:hypothetical protein
VYSPATEGIFSDGEQLIKEIEAIAGGAASPKLPASGSKGK